MEMEIVMKIIKIITTKNPRNYPLMNLENSNTIIIVVPIVKKPKITKIMLQTRKRRRNPQLLSNSIQEDENYGQPL